MCMGQYEIETEKANEKKIDSLALQLVNLCGFNDGDNFNIDGLSIEFKMGGLRINSEADVYVARRSGSSDQVVMIWEDKISTNEDTHLAKGKLTDSAAQIVGELISAHYRNWTHNHKPCEVYAIRLIDDMVAFFKMEMSHQEIENVCEKGVIPETKLKVCYTPKHALETGEEYGVSLLSQKNRLWFVKMMACIRAKILNTPAEAPTRFVSKKAGKDANPEDL
eukprot:TRINITY_DN842_c1_g3_i2.p2 TRINITY_DN842_c1_g3~~TRINITY_DN842_c1_g3_i2.p2  ORF type:complete len:222 (+),score=49.96 TRINITY_DN842_c1_g3_i2:167-832(+)